MEGRSVECPDCGYKIAIISLTPPVSIGSTRASTGNHSKRLTLPPSQLVALSCIAALVLGLVFALIPGSDSSGVSTTEHIRVNYLTASPAPVASTISNTSASPSVASIPERVPATPVKSQASLNDFPQPTGLPDSAETKVANATAIMPTSTTSPTVATPQKTSRPEVFPDKTSLVTYTSLSIVRIEWMTPSGEPRGGSGVVVGKRKWVLTNLHAVRLDAGASIYFSDETKGSLRRPFAVDPDRNLALCEIVPSSFPLETVEPLKIAEKLPALGETVVAFETPHEKPFSSVASQIRGIRKGEEFAEFGGVRRGTWIQTDIPVNVANVGGPILNFKGEIVGLNHWSSLGKRNLHFAPSADDIRQFLSDQEKKADVAEQTNPKPKPRPMNPSRAKPARTYQVTHPTKESLLKSIEPAIVTIEAIAGSEKRVFSGCIFAKEGVILTAMKPMMGVVEATVTYHNGTKAKVLGSTSKFLVSGSIRLFVEKPKDPLPELPLDDSDLKPGTRMLSVARTAAGEIQSAEGVFQEFCTKAWLRPYGYSGNVTSFDNFLYVKGTSPANHLGGPLVNFHGEVIGVNLAPVIDSSNSWLGSGMKGGLGNLRKHRYPVNALGTNCLYVAKYNPKIVATVDGRGDPIRAKKLFGLVKSMKWTANFPFPEYGDRHFEKVTSLLMRDVYLSTATSIPNEGPHGSIFLDFIPEARTPGGGYLIRLKMSVAYHERQENNTARAIIVWEDSQTLGPMNPPRLETPVTPQFHTNFQILRRRFLKDYLEAQGDSRYWISPEAPPRPKEEEILENIPKARPTRRSTRTTNSGTKGSNSRSSKPSKP